MEGENKWSPLPINLQRHVYHPMLGNSDEQDFFNLEKALQGSVFSIIITSASPPSFGTSCRVLDKNTVFVLRMAHRIWKETEQQTGTAVPGNMLGCCF